MRFVYSLLFYLILPFVFLRLLWRSRCLPAYRKKWGERLGYCPHQFKQSIWVHAASVGETIAALPLINALLQAYPSLPIIVTNMTPTGAARVNAALKDNVSQAYIPYDLPDAVGRFLNKINPCIAIVMETELWPNFFAGCRKKGIPVVIANARLSEKSAMGYMRIAGLTRDMLASVHSVAAQGPADVKRFLRLGVASEKITETGNLKFDIELPQDLQDKSAAIRKHWGEKRLVWIAASTHPGEEEMVIAAHRIILEKYSSALLVLVPRHPERFSAVATLVKLSGLRVARRSLDESCSDEVTVYLGDTMGELLYLYAVADVAFVAGSFSAIGGHNMLEPAVLKKPIITGPVLFNFFDISQKLLRVQGMVVVKDAEALATQVMHYFSVDDSRQWVGNNAYQVVAKNRGALQRQLRLIRAAIDGVVL